MLKVIYDDERGERYYQNIDEMIYENLVIKKLDFNKVTTLYVKYLEQLEKLHIKQLSEADIPIINSISPINKMTSKKACKDTAYRYLVKYERYKGAPIWDDLVKYCKENNINLDGSYMCDLYNKELENER